ncbi:MAG TPA: DUF2625 domain-containing protein [Gemmataceae bacterium]
MRELNELLEREEPAWPLVQEWIREASNPVEVLPPADPDRSEALLAVQVTTRSPMGSVVYETGGLLIDRGWIRVLGSGHPRLPRSLPRWNEGRTSRKNGEQLGFLLVADDVLGGFFALNGGGFEGEMGQVWYAAPDTLKWENLEVTYSEFLYWCFTGDLAQFYGHLRWPGWEEVIGRLPGDQGVGIYPPLPTEGPSIADRHRGLVSLEEMYRLHVDADA